MKNNETVLNGGELQDQRRFSFAEGLTLSDAVGGSGTNADLSHRLAIVEARSGRVESLLKKVSGQVGELAQAFAAVLREMESNLTRVLDENRRLRTREWDFGVVDPLANRLVQVLDRQDCDLQTIRKSVQTAGKAVDRRAASFLIEARALDREEVIAALRILGVEAFRTTVGSRFDPQRQKRIGGTKTADPTLAGTVSELVRPGYERLADRWVIRPEWVNVFQLEPQANPSKKERK